jgi:mycothiol synthase
MRQALDMGVHWQAGQVECHAAEDVGRLTSDAWQRHQVFHPSRDNTVEPLHDGVGHADDAAGLGPEEARRSDQHLDLIHRCGGQRRCDGKPGKEVGRDTVDPFVGALCRQDGGGQELEGVTVVERAQFGRRPRKQLAETAVGLPCPSGWSPGSRHERTLPAWIIPSRLGTVEALDLDVWAVVDATASAVVRELVARIEATTGRPGLSEDRLRALDHAARGDRSAPLTGVSARRPGHSDLVGWAQIDGPGDGRALTLEAVVLPHLDGSGLDDSLLDTLVDSALAEFVQSGGGPLRWWVNHASDTDDMRAAARGFSTERDLIQLRCALPLPARPVRPSGRATVSVTTRAFRVGQDEAGWLLQNNRAFDGHPEQGRWDLATLETREAEAWFDPQGFRVLEVDGRIAGSCWTKVHSSATSAEGEIYVIGVDPDFHGRGWGRALTEDGFAWLASQGVRSGMLYVDAANLAAVGLYTSMGMTTDHVDRSYVNPSVVTPDGQTTRESSTPSVPFGQPLPTAWPIE